MQFFSIAVSGAVSGSIYALLAIGLVLSYQTSRIFNFGHAATAFASAYLYYQLHVALDWNKWLVLIGVVVIFAPMMGWVWDRLVFAKLAGAEESTKIVAGVGVLVVVPAVTVLICTGLKELFDIGFQDVAEVYLVPGILPPAQHTIAPGLTISNNQIVALVVSTMLFLALWTLLRFSALGLRMRASVDSPSLARLRGINTRRVSTLSWMISFGLAGVAGVLAAPFPGPFGLLNDNYTLALFIAIASAVVARLSSIPIAFATGLALGAGRNLVVGYVNEDHLGAVGGWLAGVYGLTASVPFLVLFIALIVLGQDKRIRKAGSVASAVTSIPDYRDDLTPAKKAVPWVIMSTVVMVAALTVMNGIWLQLVIFGFALGILFLSFTILTGLGGMVSLAQGAFATAAALTVGVLSHHGWPFLPALIVGVLLSCILGALTALPALRVSGLSLTFATLALALLASNVLFKIEWFSNGALGWTIKRPSFGPVDLGNDKVFLVVIFVIVIAMVKVASNLSGSATGRAIIAIRTAESAAAASGVSPRATKLTLFVLSAGVAGLGGVLAAMVYGTVLGTANPPQSSFLWLAVVVIVGVRSPGGAIIAGMVCAVLPRIVAHGFDLGVVSWGGTNNDLIAQVLFGIGAIQLAAQPNGLLAELSRSARERRDAKVLRKRGPIKIDSPAGLNPTEPTVVRTVGAPMEDATSAVPALLVIDNVRAAYGDVQVLHDVSLTVQRGEILALLGANGSGKSTLCSVAGGIVDVTAGSIWFDGEDITGMDAAQRVERGMILVPESRGIFPALTVDQNLSISLPKRADRDLAYARFPSLARRMKQPAGNLSGGEQQMLSLAPFLVQPPKLLISDEPSLGLAQLITTEIMAAFEQLRDEGTAVVLVEEKARDVLKVADRVGALQRGDIAWVVDRSEVDAERVASAYLGMTTV